MKYHFKVHKEGSGFWAQCIELVGSVTEADSMEELQENIRKALNLYVKEPENSKELAPLPDESKRTFPSFLVDYTVNWSTIPLDRFIFFR